MLLYLAEKFGALLPEDAAGRTETLNWLFWQMASTPMLGGGFGHFFAYATEKYQYPIDRYTMDVKRQLDVLDRQLAHSRYVAGDSYTIADIAIWPWYGGLVNNLYNAAEFLDAKIYTHVLRWSAEVAKRPAAQRGRMVNRINGKPHKQLRERHDASDFELRTEDKINSGGGA
jgi:GST-like protein